MGFAARAASSFATPPHRRPRACPTRPASIARSPTRATTASRLSTFGISLPSGSRSGTIAASAASSIVTL